jgi:DNA-directed RNA polymerase subunit beta
MRVIQPTSKRIGRFLEVPNLIELQLNSYKWFLEEGLPELFATFSPIWDFTQTNYIELVSFTLGEPKYSIQECRDRDMTFEAPIKAIVRFGGRDREVIESEVYLGDLPLMTDKGTFIINGRERVIVSQLSRSPGLYFEEGVDSSMQVIVSARVIPNEGPWLEVESDANLVVRTQISQTKKLPLTQLMKALYYFEKGRGRQNFAIGDAIGKRIIESIVDLETGEVVLEAGKIVTADDLAGLSDGVKAQKSLVETPLGTNDEILKAFSKEVVLEHPDAEMLLGKRVLADISDADGLIIRSGEKIERETAKKLESLNLESLKVLDILGLVESTLDADPTSNAREALLDIYKRLRPGEAANEEAAKQLVYGLFFDVKRYDLGKVGRRFLNQKLHIDVPLNTRNLTSVDLAAILQAMLPYVQREADRDDIDDLKNKRVRSVGELLQSQLRLGFVRMEKVARERMTSVREAGERVDQELLQLQPALNVHGSDESAFRDHEQAALVLPRPRRPSANQCQARSTRRSPLALRPNLSDRDP